MSVKKSLTTSPEWGDTVNVTNKDTNRKAEEGQHLIEYNPKSAHVRKCRRLTE